MNRFIFLSLCLNATGVSADDSSQDCMLPDSSVTKDVQQFMTVKSLRITTNPIFDEAEPDTIPLHHFANWLHTNTKAEVIEERLPFKTGDRVSEKELAEAERILRSQPFIRDARVGFSGSCKAQQPVEIEIQTWDNWSMMPTVSFGRKGG
jgi:hypothetical protein